MTVFDLKQRYLNSLFEKHGAEIKYENEDLAQVNPQLYEWLRTVNAKSSNTSLFNSDNSVKEQFSIGKSEDVSLADGADQEQDAAEPSRVDALPSKTRAYLERVERGLVNGLANALSVPVVKDGMQQKK